MCPRSLEQTRRQGRAALQVLQKEVPWRTGSVVMFGKPVLQPRMFCYMADDTSQGYSYAGLAMVVEPWHPAVLPVKVHACQAHCPRCDSCMVCR